MFFSSSLQASQAQPQLQLQQSQSIQFDPSVLAQLRSAKCSNPEVNQQLQEILQKIQVFTNRSNATASGEPEEDRPIGELCNTSFANHTPAKPSHSSFTIQERAPSAATGNLSSMTPPKKANGSNSRSNSYLTKSIQRSTSKTLASVSPIGRDSRTSSNLLSAATAATTQSSTSKQPPAFYSSTTSATPQKQMSCSQSQQRMHTYHPSVTNSSTPSKFTPSRHNSKSNSNSSNCSNADLTNAWPSYQSVHSNYSNSFNSRTNSNNNNNNNNNANMNSQEKYRRNIPSQSPLRSSVSNDQNMAAIKSWIASHENRFATLLNGQVEMLDETCTFHPNLDLTRGYVSQKNRAPGDFVGRLFDDSKYKRKEHLQEQSEQVRQAKELEECTFKPVINQVRAGESSGGMRNKENEDAYYGEVKGFDGAVERLRSGFSKSQKRFEELTQIPRGSFFERNKSRKFNPPSMLSRNANVFYTAKITLSNGVTQKKITMSEDDDPVELAKQFALANALSPKEHATLERTLVDQFKAHLLELIRYATESNQL